MEYGIDSWALGRDKFSSKEQWLVIPCDFAIQSALYETPLKNCLEAAEKSSPHWSAIDGSIDTWNATATSLNLLKRRHEEGRKDMVPSQSSKLAFQDWREC